MSREEWTFLRRAIYAAAYVAAKNEFDSTRLLAWSAETRIREAHDHAIRTVDEWVDSGTMEDLTNE